MNLDFSQIVPSMPYILKGIGVTIQIVLASAILGFVLGVILSLCKISRNKPLQWFADAYTSVFRGTPLVLQLLLIYFGLPQLLGFDIAPFPAAVAAFGLNSAAYISEIIRAGILAVDKGQREAALALGIPYRRMMGQIILPQALKNILPALMNEFITLTKESAIVTVIGALDIMRRAYIVGGEKFAYLEPLIFAGLIYYVMVMGLTLLGKAVERRMRKGD
ncbi:MULTISPECIES: amino acid ABC transporter permease [Priestia]|uniref:Arginine ABC transporter, permease protein ArtQ n=6 Tax=Priestia TaxID=2800373 RepID=D5DS43_PRIM1|nr:MULTISPECIES: amino acid ABC transporter permease [Priestia]AVX10320.1 amino acid ABC transporter permease [Bacillus sp. Y-01]KOP76408.1 arginine ABC transporter permease [Bacillus sp. FJAT-21351]KQU19576.1 arginine ABC transporter permease [Bacillus sp. Leaf75]KRD89473.1 arginine ABC transporter permease [Bacillus sp. Root147]KRE05688.1 arginine ABC transporter permease [Bacillus sp. Root239]KRF57711.1 arginine ABC transporter permease [Bacillus sp. Soil531]MBK0007987.1 amino acid ABC tr